MTLTFALQALLVRHESYVASAESDRKQLLAKMDALEQEKRTLESKNQATIEENRKLLDQLELLNSAVAESESHAESLTEAMQSTERELERLQGLVGHTERLQRQLARLEEEQERLHGEVGVTKDNERAAWQQYQQAQRTILSLHVQIEEIEREVSEERERHADLLERINRRKAVETELRASAARLNRAPTHATSSTVVSHFVKDILQDNANMQLGVMELRELLQQSNEEVEKLREQLTEQPSSAELTTAPLRPPLPDLGVELGTKELHVHHHYHAPSPTTEQAVKAPRSHIRRVAKRKRAQFPHTPHSGLQTPRPSIGSVWRPASPPSSSTILSHTTVTVPQQAPIAQRWSVQSNQTGFTTSSSLPSSPFSESDWIFDQPSGALNTDLSRPTSPESNGIFSPGQQSRANVRKWNSRVKHGRHASESLSASDLVLGLASRASTSCAELAGDAIHTNPPASVLNAVEPLSDASSIIHEENEDQLGTPAHNSSSTSDRRNDEEEPPDSPFDPSSFIRRERRGSMLSISGMDIHTLSARPSQLFIGGASRRNLSAPIVAATSTAFTSAVFSSANATAIRPDPNRNGTGSGDASLSKSYLSSVARDEGRRSLAKKPSKGILGAGKSIGGWVFGKWGVAAVDLDSPARPRTAAQSPAPALVASSTRSAAVSTASTANTMPTLPIAINPAISRLKGKATLSPSPSPANASPLKLRPPGVNQFGPIFGFRPEPPTPFKTRVDAAEVDLSALRQGLEE